MGIKPSIVAIGGTASDQSSTEHALRIALDAAEKLGARVEMFGGSQLRALPHYTTPGCMNNEIAQRLVGAVREAHGIIIASPGYHGTISGLVKNAIDYLEETSKDERVYLDGVPVGLIATSYGWQAASHTLGTLRTIVHSLRGWPTPLGAGGLFKDGQCSDAAVTNQLGLVGHQVFEFARREAMMADTAHIA
jgi:FMN reductase